MLREQPVLPRRVVARGLTRTRRVRNQRSSRLHRRQAFASSCAPVRIVSARIEHRHRHPRPLQSAHHGRRRQRVQNDRRFRAPVKIRRDQIVLRGVSHLHAVAREIEQRDVVLAQVRREIPDRARHPRARRILDLRDREADVLQRRGHRARVVHRIPQRRIRIRVVPHHQRQPAPTVRRAGLAPERAVPGRLEGGPGGLQVTVHAGYGPARQNAGDEHPPRSSMHDRFPSSNRTAPPPVSHSRTGPARPPPDQRRTRYSTVAADSARRISRNSSAVEG